MCVCHVGYRSFELLQSLAAVAVEVDGGEHHLLHVELRAVEQFEKRDIPTRPVIRIKNSKKITIID